MTDELKLHGELSLCEVLFHRHRYDHVPVVRTVFKELTTDLTHVPFTAIYENGVVMDIRLKNVIYTMAEYGINLVIFPVCDDGIAGEPVMLCINADGKLFGKYMGWINMEPDIMPDEE